MRAALAAPFSLAYGTVVSLRNRCFDAGLLPVRRAGVPVISVGNLTAGGTGKTPLVEYIARVVTAAGRRVVIVSRGYGRNTRGVLVVSEGAGPLVTAREAGDEPVELARALPGVPVVVGERRVEAAAVAVGRLAAEAILLDDGFQHRWLGRDLDIVTVSARRDPAKERLLPGGMLREPLSGLGRAHLVVITHADDVSDVRRVAGFLRSRWRGPEVAGVHEPAGFTSPGGAAIRREDLPSGNPLLFTGVADPDAVEESVKRAGLTPVGHVRFPDHHRLEGEDVRRIQGEAVRSGAGFLVTTRKDAARLSGDAGLIGRLTERFPLVVLQIVFRCTSGEDVLRTMVRRAAR
jgi:tetraacyldisaccharide 4'-kinase